MKEQAVLFERECRSLPQEEVDRSITLAKYTELWLQSIAPGKLAKSTLARDRQDIDRFLPVWGTTSWQNSAPNTSVTSMRICESYQS